MIFTSIIGTQIMGALQPWLALRATGRAGSAYLLHTPQTENIARKLRKYAQEHDFGEVFLAPVSCLANGEPDSAGASVERIAAGAAARDERVCFNIDGGMNYLINDCALRLAPYDPVFIQSSRWRSTLHDTRSGEFSTLAMPEPLSVGQILELQGVSYTLEEKNPDQTARKSVLAFCSEFGLALPPDSLQNVKIDNFVFDLVWNPGNNRLSFFKDWRFWIEDPRHRLALERDFAHWSTDRTRSGHLYDKRIFTLAADPKTAERLVSESGGQIEARLACTGKEAGAALEKWFKVQTCIQKEQILPAPKKSCHAELRDRTLLVCMGRNLDSTLLAICSHKPEHLILCYQKTDPLVGEHVNLILENYGALGLASAQAVPFGIEGAYPEQSLPPVPQGCNLDVDINLSPGSKGQGVSLAWWARKHGFGVWSLANGPRQCVPLHNPGAKAPLPYDLCDPALYFALKGMTLRSGSRSEKDLAPVMPAMDALLEFLREALAAGKDEGVFHYPVQVGEGVLHRPGREFWELRFKGKIYAYQVLGDFGKWFEELCAVALLRAGASHVRVNCARRWSEDIEYKLVMKKRLEETPHSLELDVVGTFEGDLVLISCKSNIKAELGAEEEAAREAKATGASLGRFGLRVLAHLRCPRAYTACNDAVLVIGWRELCQPDLLAARLRELRSRQRTTNQQEDSCL